jgi:hypothetical protein
VSRPIKTQQLGLDISTTASTSTSINTRIIKSTLALTSALILHFCSLFLSSFQSCFYCCSFSYFSFSFGFLRRSACGAEVVLPLHVMTWKKCAPATDSERPFALE